MSQNQYNNKTRNEIAFFVKNNFYNNKEFWNREQNIIGFVKEWTENQVEQIFKTIMWEFLPSRPINEWGQQIKQRVMGTIKAVPLILDDTPNHPSKAEIARRSGFKEYSSAVEELIILLRPVDYNKQFLSTGDRNPAKRPEIRIKIADKRRDKIKIDNIRKAVGNFIFMELLCNSNQDLTLEYIINNIEKSTYLNILKKVKISVYVRGEIESIIKTSVLILEPYFQCKKGLSQVEINSRTNVGTSIIKDMSVNFEKNFRKLYSHEERFSKGWNKGLGSRKSTEGDIIQESEIRDNVCNYIFSRLYHNWNQILTVSDILNDISLNPNLVVLEGINISDYLMNQFDKYIITVRLMMGPYFSNDINLNNLTIVGIHNQSGLDHKQIRQISKSFEYYFGKNIYNNLERFPIPQDQTRDIIKGYPKEFYDPKLRREIRLSQTVIISGERLIQNIDGVFRDLLTGEPINDDENRDLHHINYIKLDCQAINLCFLKSKNHNKISANQFNSVVANYFQKLLENNKLCLIKGIIPKTWLDRENNFLNFVDENQLDLSKWSRDI